MASLVSLLRRSRDAGCQFQACRDMTLKWHRSEQQVVSISPGSLNQRSSLQHQFCSDADGSVTTIIWIPLAHFFSKKINILHCFYVSLSFPFIQSCFMMILGAEAESSCSNGTHGSLPPHVQPNCTQAQCWQWSEVMRGTPHSLLGGPETTPASPFTLSANKPPLLPNPLPSRCHVSLPLPFSRWQHWMVLWKRCRLENVVFHWHWWWFPEMRKPKPRAVVGNVNCGFGRVYFSIFYEENDLFSKTEVIFLTYVVTSK